MRPNALKRMLAAGQPAIGGWLAIPSTYSAEIMARQGYDCVNVDLQHGMTEPGVALGMLQAISTTDATPLVRVGGNDPETIMKVLDMGAYGVICPMVSTADDARRFVSACRYPPVGERSFGPARGLLYGGPDYFAKANDEILAIAMIETREGVDNMEAIAAVEGVDAFFIGPNDLALDLGKSDPHPELDDEEVKEAVERIRVTATNAGKPTGIFCSSPQAAIDRVKQGFALVVPGHDASMLTAAARGAVQGFRSALRS